MIVYLAAPFFNPTQNAVLTEIEGTLTMLNFTVISPRKSGLILKDMTPEQRRLAAPVVYKKNIVDMKSCQIMLAVIDDRDPGTMFELGFAACLGIDTYTFTSHDYGLNVMISGGVRGHARGMSQLREMMHAVKNGANTDRFAADAAT